MSNLQCALHRSCTSVVREQGRVDIEGATAWDVEESLWQHVAIGSSHAEVGLQGCQAMDKLVL